MKLHTASHFVAYVEVCLLAFCKVENSATTQRPFPSSSNMDKQMREG